MKTVFKPVLMAAFILFALPISAQRSNRTQDPTLNKGEGLSMSRKDLDKMRNQKQDKNSLQVDVYMFAASFSMLDSVLYISDVQFLKDVTVNNRWFLKERVAFEKQFTDYVAGSDMNESLMTSVQFFEKEKKLIKKRERLIKRNKRKNGFKMYQVSDFKFSNPAPADED
ncbi:MAG: hypothetical protein J5596_03465 [Bacteroidaceae bacterium]|nr:hypothetical protein [Bacteroidaceae bacterium]